MNNSIIVRRVMRHNVSQIRTLFVCRTRDVMTHTGQQWDSDDYRMVRYTNCQKLVNPNWAMHLVADMPVRQLTQRVVWCDGGSGIDGHPRVYINLDKPGEHACGYCGLRFTKIDAH